MDKLIKNGTEKVKLKRSIQFSVKFLNRLCPALVLIDDDCANVLFDQNT